MKKHEIKPYSSVENYNLFSKTYRVFTGLVIFSIQKHELSIKRIIIRNFLAKSVASLQGIFALWELKNYHDCYVLLRIITDRLFYLYDLIENDTFIEFDDWSFYQKYCSSNNKRSDINIKHKITPKAFVASQADKDRFIKLQNNKFDYKRPDPEKISRTMGLHFLYKYDYDNASKFYVHPTSYDGAEDLIHLTGLYSETELPDHRSVLSNALLSTHLLHNHALLGDGFLWRREVINFMDSAMEFLKTGDNTYQKAFLDLKNLGSKAILCKEK